MFISFFFFSFIDPVYRALIVSQIRNILSYLEKVSFLTLFFFPFQLIKIHVVHILVNDDLGWLILDEILQLFHCDTLELYFVHSQNCRLGGSVTQGRPWPLETWWLYSFLAVLLWASYLTSPNIFLLIVRCLHGVFNIKMTFLCVVQSTYYNRILSPFSSVFSQSTW